MSIASTGLPAQDFGDLVQKGLCGGSSQVQSRTRGVFGGGDTPGAKVNLIQYVTISTLGNAADFGDLVTDNYGGGGCSNAVRGLRGGGAVVPSTAATSIEYITIATLGNALDFGDMATTAWYTSACASPTRGVWGGGANPSRHNVIQYVQIMSTGNAIDFGDILDTTYELGALSNGNGGLG